MCVSKHEVRPGLDGIVDYIDTIEDVRRKLKPIFSLLILSDGIKNIDVLDNEELSNLGALLRDLCDEVFLATDGIYNRYREVTHE